jgi:hypothetical protein
VFKPAQARITCVVAVIVLSTSVAPWSLADPVDAREERAKEHAALVQELTSYAVRAIEQLESSGRESATDPMDQRFLSIRVLELLRWQDAVPTLLRFVELQRDPTELGASGLYTPLELYPAVGALVAIGRSSTKACIRALMTAEGTRRKRLLQVVEYVETRDVARLLIKRYIRDVGTLPKEHRRNLKRALRELR